MEFPYSLDKLLQTMVTFQATSLFLSAGRPPLFRIDGQWRPSESPVLRPIDVNLLTNLNAPKSDRDDLEQFGIAEFDLPFDEANQFTGYAIRNVGEIQLLLCRFNVQILH